MPNATTVRRLLRWPLLIPPAAVAMLAASLVWHPTAWPWVLLVTLFLVGAVMAAVEHAEVVAHRIGEPFGSLLLAVAVTIIEVGLIVALMMNGGDGVEHLARDTVFAALMITVNGIAGLSLLVNAGSHDTAEFRETGTSSALATVLILAVLTMVIPNYTSAPGPTLSNAQLLFVAVSAVLLYAGFVTTLTHTHRDYFLPMDGDGELVDADHDGHADAPSNATALRSLAMLLAALVSVVGLAKVLSPSLDRAVQGAGLPHSFVGVVIAMVVLAPETISAVKASRRDRVQTSMNLAYGSAMASIGLTIPVMAVIGLITGMHLVLGLNELQLALLAGTAVASILTVSHGRVTHHAGTIHLVLLAAFVFLAAKP